MPSYSDIATRLRHQIVKPAPDTPLHEEWLKGGGVIDLLQRTRTQDVPVLAVTKDFYLCAVLVPAEKMPADLREASEHWYCNASRLWNISAWRDRKTSEVTVGLYPPSIVTGTGVFDDAEPVVFWRELPRSKGGYIEANQKLAHSAGVHRIEERSAYARLDALGDYEDIIRYGPFPDGILCTVNARVLDQYMQATGTVMVRFFQVDQLESTDVWTTHEEVIEWFEDAGTSGIRYQLENDGLIGGTRLHGIQMIKELGDRDENLKQLLGEDEENHRKVSFRIRGEKEGSTRWWPPKPSEERGRTPSPITPVYFRPDVLTKYKADPEKYEVTGSTVECIDTWFLRSYDVNSEKQVYAYLKDLWDLPYSEQFYWASFNEAPRTGITQRSWQQDFEAKRWLGHDDLHELAQLLRTFPAPDVQGVSLEIWTSDDLDKPGGLAVVRLHRLLTESSEDWARHILDLNKVVVEGIVKETLKKIAKTLGVEKDQIAKERSLKLLERILRQQGVGDQDVEKICSPLYEINHWRSEGGVGHRGGRRPEGSLRAQYDELIARTYNAMKALADLIEAGVLNVPEIGKLPA